MGEMLTGLPRPHKRMPVVRTATFTLNDRVTPGSFTATEVAVGHDVSPSVGKSLDVMTNPADAATPGGSVTAEGVPKAGPGPVCLAVAAMICPLLPLKATVGYPFSRQGARDVFLSRRVVTPVPAAPLPPTPPTASWDETQAAGEPTEAARDNEYKIVRATIPFPARPMLTSSGVEGPGTVTLRTRIEYAGVVAGQAVKPWRLRQCLATSAVVGT